jgi:uncharacterized protein YpiB (UPF0302 family)
MTDQFALDVQLLHNMQKIDAALDAKDVRRFLLLCQRRASLRRQLKAAEAKPVEV